MWCGRSPRGTPAPWSRRAARHRRAPRLEDPNRSLMLAPNQQRFLIIADGQFGPLTSKTANSCIRYFPDRIVAVFDRTEAGKTVQHVLGFGGAIPVGGDFARGLALGPPAVLIRIAPIGGPLPGGGRGGGPAAPPGGRRNVRRGRPLVC